MPSKLRDNLEVDPDAHPTTPEFWAAAKVVLPVAKQPVTIRLDTDLLAWLRRRQGYQTRINAVLRAYMDSQTRATEPNRGSRV